MDHYKAMMFEPPLRHTALGRQWSTCFHRQRIACSRRRTANDDMTAKTTYRMTIRSSVLQTRIVYW